MSTCINPNSEDFKNELKSKSNILLAEIGVDEKFKNYDSFSPEFETEDLKEDSDNVLKKNNSILYGETSNWDFDQVEKMTQINDTLLYALKNNPKYKITDPVTLNKLNSLIEAIGENEAYRDYFENNMSVRTSDVVIEKLLNRLDAEHAEDFNAFVSDQEQNQQDKGEKTDVTVFNEILNTHNNQIAINAMDKFSLQLNIPYEIITLEQAREITGNLENSKSFYKSGKVFFIGSQIEPSTVFHEFLHPVIKSMRKDNPALFNSLYNQLFNTKEGAAIINDLIKNSTDYNPGSDEFKEESIVRYLENENNYVTPESKSFLKELFFNIKQFLRKIFGRKIDVSKLNRNTTFSDLLNMINKGEEFLLNNDFLNIDDYVMFKKVYEDEINQLKSQSLEDTQRVMNEFYSLVKRQLSNFKASEGIFVKIQEDLADENNTGLFQKMQKSLEELAVYGSRKTVSGLQFSNVNLDRDLEIIDNKLRSFVQVINLADLVFKKFETKLKDLELVGVKTNDQFDQLFAIMQYIDDWKEYLEKAKNNFSPFVELASGSEYELSPIAALISKVESSLNKANLIADKLKVESVVDVIYDHLKNLMDPIVKSHLEQMDAFKKANMLKSYDKWHKELYGLTVNEKAELQILESKNENSLSLDEKERKLKLTLDSYDSYIITRDSVIALASNKLGDADKWNGLMESYLANQDKFVGSFYEFLTRTFNTIDANVNSKQQDLLKKLKSNLKSADEINYVFGEGGLGKDIGQVSNVGKKVNGAIENYHEYQFMSNYINHEFELNELINKLSRANKEFNLNPSDENKKAVEDIENEIDKFNSDYMTRPYVDAYYELEKYFDSDAGKKAKEKRKDIFERMRIVTDNIVYDPTNFILSSEMKSLWSEYQRLFSDYDILGKKKTGDDLEIASILKKWREASSDFYEWNELPNFFETSLNEMITALKKQNFIPGTPAFDEQIKQWLEHNTQVEVKDEYFERRKNLIALRSELLEPIISQNTQIKDVGPLYEQIYELLKGTRDTSNQNDGTAISPQVASKIVLLHEEIEEAKQFFIQLNGRSLEDNRRFNMIQDYLEAFDQFPTDLDQTFYYDYLNSIDAKLAEMGISPADIQQVKDIDNELNILTTSASTHYYMDQFQALINLNADTKQKFEDYMKNQMHVDLAIDEILEEHINQMLEDPEFIRNVLLADDSVLAEWFFNNHYTSTVNKFNKADGKFIGEMEVFKKTAAWQFSSPRDNSFYNTKSTVAFNSDLSSVLPNGYLELNGIPRVPSKTYFSRDVKPKYRTEIIERDYVDNNGNLILANQDNRGRWLPKENAKDQKFINSNYRNLFNTDREKFDLLLYLKNTALDWEENLDNSQKMYLTYGKFRKGSVEQFGKGFFKAKVKRIVETFGFAEDDAENGYFFDQGIKNLDNVTLTRPISGNYKLDINDTSTNIIRSMLDRMYSIEHFKAMREVNSFVNVVEKALVQMSKNPQLLEIEKNLRDSALLTSSVDVKQLERIKAIQNIIDRHFKGITLKFSSFQKDKLELGVVKTLGVSQKLISFKTFMLEPIKSLTNYFGGKSAMWKKGIDGRAYTLKDLIYTRSKSLKGIKLIIKDMYSKEKTPLELQLINIMGAVPGRLRNEIGETANRTLIQSAFKGKFLFFDRRMLSESVPVHQFYAILRKNSFMLNGKLTSLDKAIELVDGKIQTKPGVPKEFSISYNNKGNAILGDRLLEIRNIHEALMNKNLGITTEFTEAEMFRSVYIKAISFLKKFFYGMYFDRLQARTTKGKRGEKRINFATKQTEIGSYIAIVDLLKEIYDSNGNLLKYKSYSDHSKRGTFQLLLGVMFYELNKLIQSLIVFHETGDEPYEFSYDPDAEHIYKKLENSTSPLPILPAALNNKYNPYMYGTRFDAENWTKITALRLLLRVNSEESAFFKFSSYMQMISGSHPLSEGGILGEVVDLANLYVSEDQYEQAVGPYFFQDKASFKYQNQILKNLGINGDFIFPIGPLKRENSGYFK